MSRPLVDIRLDTLSTRGGRPPGLDAVSVHVRYGEFFTFLGPPHSGKTDVLKAVAGFMPVTSGRILVDAQDIAALPPGRRSTGYVFQEGALWPHLTVREHVAFGLEQQGLAADDVARRVEVVATRLGLTACVDRRPAALTLAERRRLALARALAVEPRVLLLDEPLSALDAKVRVQLRDEIRRLQLELGITTVFVTHDQEEALSLADRVGVLRAGRLEQCAAPDELYTRPATAFVAEFVGTMNRIPGVLRADGLVSVLDQTLTPLDGGERAPGTAVDVLVRPESVEVVAAADGTARVVTRTFHGASSRIRVALGTGTEIVADVASVHAGEMGPGAGVTVRLADRAVLIANQD